MTTSTKRFWTVLACCVLSLLISTPAIAQQWDHAFETEDVGLTLDVRTQGHVASLAVTYDAGLLDKGSRVTIDFGDGETAPILETRVNLTHAYMPTANPTPRTARVAITDANGAVVAETSETFATEAAFTLELSPLTVSSPGACDWTGPADFYVLWAEGQDGAENARFELNRGESLTIDEFAYTADSVNFGDDWRTVLAMLVSEVDLFDDGFVLNGPTGEIVRTFDDESYVVTGDVAGCASAFWSFEASLELIGR